MPEAPCTHSVSIDISLKGFLCKYLTTNVSMCTYCIGKGGFGGRAPGFAALKARSSGDSITRRVHVPK